MDAGNGNDGQQSDGDSDEDGDSDSDGDGDSDTGGDTDTGPMPETDSYTGGDADPDSDTDSGRGGGTDSDIEIEGTVVAIQQTETDPEALTMEEIRTMVTTAVTQAGGLGFIEDGQTVVISLPVLKTHTVGGITGAVKNIGIGMIPVGKYKSSRPFDNPCTRDSTVIDHGSISGISPWIQDIYSLNPADFAVVDGLRGRANGPDPTWGGGNYDTDLKKMRLILASRDPVALDVIEAQVMECDPGRIDYLQALGNAGLGTADPAEITVVGKQVSEVSQPLEGSFACPG